MVVGERMNPPWSTFRAVSANRLLWVVLFVEAALVMWLQSPWLFPDSAAYIRLAHGDASAFEVRMPGYALFLALLRNHAVAVAVQMLLYLASLALVASLFRRQDRFVFLGLAIFYVFPFFYSAAILSEGLAIFCVALTMWLIVRRKSWLAVGAMAGACVLVRGDLVPIIPAVLLVALWRRAWVGAASCAAAAFIVLLPCLIWNATHYGRFTPLPVRPAVGQSLYIASWESTMSLKDLKIVSGAPPTAAAKASGLADEVAAIRARGGTTEVYRDAALKRLAAHPADTALHSIKAIWRLFNTADYPAPRPVAFCLSLVSAIVWLLGFCGIVWVMLKRTAPRSPAVIFLLVLAAHLPLHTEARYTAVLRLILLFYAARLIVDASGFPKRRLERHQTA